MIIKKIINNDNKNNNKTNETKRWKEEIIRK